ENVGKILAFQAYEKGLELACRVAPDVHPCILGDPTRLRQILINLIGNAIKFTEGGEVVLEITREPTANDPEMLRFCIRDTGIGIPPDKKETIFNVFTQVDSSTTRKHGGAGLGLAITRQLVELMEGRIWIESEPGEGARFLFTIRFPHADASPTIEPAPPSCLNGMKILVVDDNGTNRLIFREHLSAWGARPGGAPDGESALEELARSEEQGAPYGLVLLDYNMPGIDGRRTVERMNAMNFTGRPVVLMLSSGAGAMDKGREKDLGVAGRLTKPVRRADLLDGILAALGKRGDAAGPSRVSDAAGEIHLPASRILLVEDIEANRMIITMYFKEEPVRVDIAENGRIGV
ncbi:MAG: response regulator, partial [Desulfobacterales bacterium]|nr:response regulator [Desulfobacterales bacterium]